MNTYQWGSTGYNKKYVKLKNYVKLYYINDV